MLDKTQKQLLIAAARSAGLSASKITAIVALAEDRTPAIEEGSSPLLVNQATAARMISGSRFLVRRLVRDGKLRRVFLTPDCIRYSRAELEKLALGNT
jgi:hypothetical protein